MAALEELRRDLLSFGGGPTLAEMPCCTLSDKGLDGPTAAHRVEEVHTPVNFAYLTCTTGSSAFQNIVGVTWQELDARVEAGKRALALAGLTPGSRLLITYPPLVSVFSKRVFDEMDIHVSFILRPSRDALLVALGTEKPDAVIGESSFLRAALVDAQRLGVMGELPENLSLIAAGSPLDSQLEEEAGKLRGAHVHDLYGCQEFGWLCLDGVPLREDIVFWDSGRPDRRRHLIVGGLPTGDCFLTRERDGGTQILTPSRRRAQGELEVTVLAAAVSDPETAARAARTILRIKAKVVCVSKQCVYRAAYTVLRISDPDSGAGVELEGPVQTKLFDDLLEAQKAYQREARTDPVWNKPC